MVTILVKPMSVNKVWKGRRQKTDEYKAYEDACSFILPKHIDIPDGKLQIDFEFGFKSAASDVDNPIKPFLDILQKRYGFNDNMVYQITSKKVVIEKGKLEYIKFKISELC